MIFHNSFISSVESPVYLAIVSGGKPSTFIFRAVANRLIRSPSAKPSALPFFKPSAFPFSKPSARPSL